MGVYQEEIDFNGIYRIADGAWIPADERNTDWQNYLIWVAEGGTPDPPPE